MPACILCLQLSEGSDVPMLTVNKGPEAYGHDGLPSDDDEGKGVMGSTRLVMTDPEPRRQEAQRQQHQDQHQDYTELDFDDKQSIPVMFEGHLTF